LPLELPFDGSSRARLKRLIRYLEPATRNTGGRSDDYLEAKLQSIFAAALPGVESTSLRQRFLDHLKARFSGALPLRIVFWDGDAIDFSPAPIVTLGLGSPRLPHLFLIGNMSGLCAA
jgi:hypothetical protein